MAVERHLAMSENFDRNTPSFDPTEELPGFKISPKIARKRRRRKALNNIYVERAVKKSL